MCLHPGVAALPPRRRIYEKRPASVQGESSDWVWLGPGLVDWLDVATPGWRDPGRWVLRLPPDVLLAQRLLVTRAMKGAPAIELDALALSLVTSLFQVGHPSAGGHRLSDRARRYILDHCEEALDLSAMGDHLGVSAAHLCVVFKRDNGITIGQFTRFVRLCQALELLEVGSRNLTDIAVRLGFSSHSHFSAQFRRAFGCTPREARRLLDG